MSIGAIGSEAGYYGYGSTRKSSEANDVMPTKATQAEMYAFFEHYDSVNGTENSYEKSMAYMCEELDSYFGDELGSLDSVKDEIAGLKEMYQSVIDDLKAAKEAALKESETNQSEDSNFRQMLVDHIAALYEKIKNGDTESEISYITCFTSEGIICREAGMGENEYLWKLDFEDEQDYEKVMDLVNSFPEDWNLKFAPNEKFWKDYLSERIDKDDFVSNLNQYSDKGKMNYLIERDGNTYINREAAKYCNYMNNPKDRIYNLQEFTELIANEIKENQKKLVDPNDEAG